MSATTTKPSPPASPIRRIVSAGSVPGPWLTATTAPLGRQPGRGGLPHPGGRPGHQRDLALEAPHITS